jgi:hypothetical protein
LVSRQHDPEHQPELFDEEPPSPETFGYDDYDPSRLRDEAATTLVVERGRKRTLEPMEADWLGRHDRVVNGSNEFIDRVFLVAAGPWFDGWDVLDNIPTRRKGKPPKKNDVV